MNNKMANANLSTIESKNQTKQTTDTIMDMERVLMVAKQEGRVGEHLRGEEIKQLQNSHGDVKNRKRSSQRSYIHDPWT